MRCLRPVRSASTSRAGGGRGDRPPDLWRVRIRGGGPPATRDQQLRIRVMRILTVEVAVSTTLGLLISLANDGAAWNPLRLCRSVRNLPSSPFFDRSVGQRREDVPPRGRDGPTARTKRPCPIGVVVETDPCGQECAREETRSRVGACPTRRSLLLGTRRALPTSPAVAEPAEYEEEDDDEDDQRCRVHGSSVLIVDERRQVPMAGGPSFRRRVLRRAVRRLVVQPRCTSTPNRHQGSFDPASDVHRASRDGTVPVGTIHSTGWPVIARPATPPSAD